MEEYKSNSHKSKEAGNSAAEKREVKRVVNGKVKAKKKSGLTKAANSFISEDMHNVKEYVLMDVLIPAAKKAISDIVSNGIEMILYGEVRGEKRKTSTNYVSYNKSYDRVNRRDERDYGRSRISYDFDDIILESKVEANEVLSAMEGILDSYGVVSIADYYDLVGVTGNYTDNKYGWTNLRNADVIRVRDGYLIKMPKAMLID